MIFKKIFQYNRLNNGDFIKLFIILQWNSIETRVRINLNRLLNQIWVCSLSICLHLSEKTKTKNEKKILKIKISAETLF